MGSRSWMSPFTMRAPTRVTNPLTDSERREESARVVGVGSGGDRRARHSRRPDFRDVSADWRWDSSHCNSAANDSSSLTMRSSLEIGGQTWADMGTNAVSVDGASIWASHDVVEVYMWWLHDAQALTATGDFGQPYRLIPPGTCMAVCNNHYLHVFNLQRLLIYKLHMQLTSQ